MAVEDDFVTNHRVAVLHLERLTKLLNWLHAAHDADPNNQAWVEVAAHIAEYLGRLADSSPP